MEKIKTKSQKTIDETFQTVLDVLSTVENLPEMNADQKWLIHHLLISLVPKVQTILDGHGFNQTDKIIERIKDAAETVAPASHVAAYG